MTRIGITQRVEVVEEYDESRDCLDQRWAPLLRSLGYVPVPLSNRIDDVDSYVTDLSLDGVVLTGGNDLAGVAGASDAAPERDAFERGLLEASLARGLPVFGVCRGLQFVNDYFGGDLSTVDGHVATTHDLTTADPPIEGVPTQVTVNSYHNYGITDDDLAGPLRTAARAPDGTVEWAYHGEHPVSAVMWHPERESPSSDLDHRIIQACLGSGGP
jgi:putative glutamine amidotransferase